MEGDHVPDPGVEGEIDRVLANRRVLRSMPLRQRILTTAALVSICSLVVALLGWAFLSHSSDQVADWIFITISVLLIVYLPYMFFWKSERSVRRQITWISSPPRSSPGYRDSGTRTNSDPGDTR